MDCFTLTNPKPGCLISSEFQMYLQINFVMPEANFFTSDVTTVLKNPLPLFSENLVQINKF